MTGLLHKNILFSVGALVCAALLFSSAFQASAGDREIFKISIPMEKGAHVTISGPSGDDFSLGRVVALPTKTRWPSYTASAWGESGTVCATAVNAVHMLVSIEKGKGRTLSITPQETIAPAAGPGASIVVSSKAGEDIFGAWAPFVGSKATVRAHDGTERPLSADSLPKKGDTLIITVAETSDRPYMVDVENRPGGRVTAWYGSGPKTIARVIVPLGGTGRFEGTLFQKTGAIRANHCGVIDVSTTPLGKTGGFQIIPWDHALRSKEMQSVWNMTQWMVVAPADGKSMMGATEPLFKKCLVSGPADSEKLWDIWSTYGRKSLVTARYNNGKWERLRESAGRQDNSLRDITELRIYFPFTEEIQKNS